MAIESDLTHRDLERTEKTQESTTPAEDSQPLPNLPQEIIVDILSRLPVKSLLQLRCVSKSWRSLISNPRFVKTHLRIASRSDDDYIHQRLILRCTCCHFNLKSCSLYSLFYKQPDEAVGLDWPVENHVRSVLILGSCNGLVCIAGGGIFIWNPSTRKFKRLPNANAESGITRSYGFGYDESTDDYKVVRIFSGVGDETAVIVHSLRSDSWRRIGDFPYLIPFDKYNSGKFANGALHWAAFVNTGSTDSCWVIVSLDLEKETYGAVVQPDYGDESPIDLKLGVLKGCLCVLCIFPSTRADVWVMNEYGMRDSWTKLFTIPRLGESRTYPRTPLCISKNGEILLEFDQRLVLYNSKDGKFRNHKIGNMCRRCQAHTYVESLVSPDVDDLV